MSWDKKGEQHFEFDTRKMSGLQGGGWVWECSGDVVRRRDPRQRVDRARCRHLHGQVAQLCNSFSRQIYFFFQSSELVENDEAHSDLTEELDWYPLQIL